MSDVNSIHVYFYLSQIGQKAELLAGREGGSERHLMVSRGEDAYKRALTLADVWPNGSLTLGLDSGKHILPGYDEMPTIVRLLTDIELLRNAQAKAHVEEEARRSGEELRQRDELRRRKCRDRSIARRTTIRELESKRLMQSHNGTAAKTIKARFAAWLRRIIQK